MHADEFVADASLVQSLLAAQFPQWAHLPLAAVRSAGTDHTLYRLGDDFVVRLPRVPWAVGQAAKEQRWLPKLAPYLPLSIPLPLAEGAPGEGYPWNWSIYRWMKGESASLERLSNPHDAAIALAQFIRALHRVDAKNGPLAGVHNSCRGVALKARDEPTRAALAALGSMIDVEAATSAWENALQTPVWDEPPVWVHGDLHGGNLLTVDGQLHAVIDFGCLGVGDPAVDLIVAWNFFSRESRTSFRAALDVDVATWARGRGWALSIALIQLPYYHQTNPSLANNARHVIREVLAALQDAA